MVFVCVFVFEFKVLLFDELFGVFDVCVCVELCVWLWWLYEEMYMMIVFVMYD